MKSTKIVLNSDVENLGRAGDVVSVAAGYARNFLLPRRMAQPWSKGIQKQIDDMARARRRREIASIEDARAVRDALVALAEVVVSKKAGESGKLFGAVSTRDIAAALEAKQIKVDHNRIKVADPIKSVGSYVVKLNLHEDVEGEVTVKVIAE